MIAPVSFGSREKKKLLESDARLRVCVCGIKKYLNLVLRYMLDSTLTRRREALDATHRFFTRFMTLDATHLMGENAAGLTSLVSNI